jgi:proteasome accessory factor C
MNVSVPRILGLLAAADSQGGELLLTEAADLLGIPADAVAPFATMLGGIGVPPFLPEDLFDVAVEGEWLILEPHPVLSHPMRLSPVDGALLLACLRTLSFGTTGPLAELCNRIEARLRDGLGKEVAPEAMSRAGSLAWHVEATFEPSVLECLRIAVAEHREVEVQYYSAGRDEQGWRRLRPWALVQHEGRWYVGAWCLTAQNHRHFRLDRTLAARLTETPFEAPEETGEAYRRPVLFDPSERPVEVDVWVPSAEESAIRGAFGEVELVERRDDRVLLRLRGATIPLILRRLFAFGESWEVVGPPEARAEVGRWCASTS